MLRSRQLPLDFRSGGGKRKRGKRKHGGARENAGRKPTGRAPGVSHLARPSVNPNHPIHVTMRVARDVPNLRAQRCARVIRAAFVLAKNRFGFRLVHFSVQGNHLHLIAEATDQRGLSRGIQGLAIRVARGINGLFGRRGKFFADRYHARSLKTPRETRNVLAYVLLNHRHHSAQNAAGNDSQAVRRKRGHTIEFDRRCTSQEWFDGWADPAMRATAPPLNDAPVMPPRAWLLRTGWKRWRWIETGETPGLHRS